MNIILSNKVNKSDLDALIHRHQTYLCKFLPIFALVMINTTVITPSRAVNEIMTNPVATSAKEKLNQQTANAVNNIPNVHINASDLQPPDTEPITGFHPIQRLLQPIKLLEAQSLQLQQQIMRLEGPIASLQPPMLGLQKKMTGVEAQVGSMQLELSSVQKQVGGVRDDIEGMRKDIRDLKKPIEVLQRPLSNVTKPLEEIQIQLSFILLAIMVASFGIAIGTPIATIFIYINRHKLFPGKEHELPKVAVVSEFSKLKTQ